jgi:hypothetical protein
MARAGRTGAEVGVNFPTIELTAAESRLLAAIAAEVETLTELGHSEESIGLAVNLALQLGSVELTLRTMRAA